MSARFPLPRIAFLALALAGLSGLACLDPARVRDVDVQVGGDTFRVDLPASSSGFDVSGVRGSGPAGTSPGPFIIRGTDLHYDSGLGALVVDVTLTNDGDETLLEPVAMTLLYLTPPGIKVLNADNGEDDAGARFDFTFANDDGVWTPGEESLPRTVQFGVGKGISIGFIARIELGRGPDLGTIAGGVWHDKDKDFIFDHDEKGIPGMTVRLTGNDIPPRETITDENGLFRFDGLASGAYTVHKLAAEGWTPTTTPEMTVLLTEVDGKVIDFFLAYFGCVHTGDDDGDDVVAGHDRAGGSSLR